MRRRLGEEEGKFCEYTAEFGFYAAKRGQNKVNNALFKNIRDAEGNFITDHVWIPIRLIDGYRGYRILCYHRLRKGYQVSSR